MINAYSIGFVCVAAAAVAGADYVIQSKVAGSAPGAYSATDYVASIPARYETFMADRAKAARQAELARVHLPEAPEGWERRSWMPDPEVEKAMVAGLSLVDKMAIKQAMRTARKQAGKQVWEYVRGTDVIRLSAHFVPAPEEGQEAEPTMAFVAPLVSYDTAQVRPYDIIQGVPVFAMTDPETGAGSGGKGALYLQAFIGDQVAIGVHAEGNEVAMRGLLARIDFDALNAMLDVPIAGIGSAAVPLTDAQKVAALEAARARYGAGAPVVAAKPVASETVVASAAEAGEAGGTQVQATGLNDHAASQVATGQAEKARPGRLQLSGGKSCLDGAAGGLCN